MGHTMTPDQVCKMLGHAVGRVFETPPPTSGICRRCGKMVSPFRDEPPPEARPE